MRCRIAAGLMLAMVGTFTMVEDASAVGRVRGMNKTATQFIDQAVRLSPTIAAQIRALEDSDLIVYVGLQILGHSTDGKTILTGVTNRARFLRITVNAKGHMVDRVVVLGHELQHALEIAAAPEARDIASLRELYRRIGVDPSAHSRFETEEARQVAFAIRNEYGRRTAGARTADASAPRVRDVGGPRD